MICLTMAKAGIDKAQLFNTIRDFPFTSPFLRATFNTYKNDGDKQSAIKFELLAQTPESDILSLRS